MIKAARLRLSMRVLDEEPIALTQPTKLGADRSYYTLDRWAQFGLISPITGDRVKLEVAYRGNVLCTSKQALQRFHKEMNGFKPRRKKAKRARVSTTEEA